MKRFLLTIAAGVALTASATPFVIGTQRVDEGLKSTFTPNVKTISPSENVPMRAGNQITIKPVINNADGDELIMLLLLRTEADGSLTVFVGEKKTDNFTFQAEEGVYDALCIGNGQGAAENIYIFKENITINATTMPEFNSADANKSVRAVNYGPNGLEVITNTDQAAEGCQVDIAQYNGITVYYGSHTYSNPLTGSVIRTNDPASTKFKMLRSQFLATTEAFLVAGFPIDFSKETIGSTGEGWQVGEMNFGSNPTFRKYEDFKTMMIEAGMVTEEEAAYAMSQYGILVDGEVFGEHGVGIFAPGYDSAKVAIWSAGEDCPIQSYIYSSGCQLTGFDSAFNSVPLVRGENCLEMAGVVTNHGFISYFTRDNTGLNANPAYSGTRTTALLGNCAPSIMITPSLGLIEISAFGRHAEEMAVDSWNIYDNIDPEGIEPIFGGELPNEVFAYFNDEQLNDDRSGYPYSINWNMNGIYKIDYSTNNVLVDGEVPGTVTATLQYNTANWNRTTPTPTIVSFFDKEGNFNDRFENAADGSLSFYVADVRFMWDDEDAPHLYFNYGEVAEVKAEYAPYGSDNFQDLNAQAYPEGNFTPGFGYNYRASLDGITTRSDNGWFDLRLSVKDANESTMVETISPAFYIGALAGVKGISADKDAETTYYNLQGIRVANPQAGQIVIERKGNTTRKIMF